MKKDEYKKKREQMVRSQIEGRGIKDERVLEVMRQIPRELFVSEKMQSQAYEDRALAVGLGQTISQPFQQGFLSRICAHQIRHLFHRLSG